MSLQRSSIAALRPEGRCSDGVPYLVRVAARFELDCAPAAIGGPRAFVADGVHMNSALQAHAGPDTLVCPSDGCAGLFGIIIRGIDAYVQPGHFEVVLVQSLDVSDSASWEDTGWTKS